MAMTPEQLKTYEHLYSELERTHKALEASAQEFERRYNLPNTLWEEVMAAPIRHADEAITNAKTFLEDNGWTLDGFDTELWDDGIGPPKFRADNWAFDIWDEYGEFGGLVEYVEGLGPADESSGRPPKRPSPVELENIICELATAGQRSKKRLLEVLEGLPEGLKERIEGL